MKASQIARLAVTDPVTFSKKLARRLHRLYLLHIVKEPAIVAVTRWYRDDGDQTLRLDYDLSEDSIVFDLGGYVGDFAASIYEKFGCDIYLFEPAPAFFEQCEERFRDNPKIRCFNFGLSDRDGQFLLSDDDDGSSLSAERNHKGGVLVQVRRLATVVDELGIDQIDLLKVNIEGSEYQLLPHLFEDALVEKIIHLQVQFHGFVDHAAQKRELIEQKLRQTHNRTWCYPFVWENWTRTDELKEVGQ